MVKPAIILDAGHGGMNHLGEYSVLKGGKQWFHKGLDLHANGHFYEGVQNRVLANMLASKFQNNGFPVFFTHEQIVDNTLTDRVRQANIINKATNGRCIFISNHFNAFEDQTVEGYEIFTSPGQTQSDELATLIFNKTKEYLPNRKYRTDRVSDGDPDKEAKFTVLTETDGIAVLIEYEFFSNPNTVLDCQCRTLIENWNSATYAACLQFFYKKGWL